jgi:hypothetical protein
MQLFNSPRLREYKEGIENLNDILKDKSKSFIIHYSCESFITNHGKTPRVTSICIRNLKTSQVISYSIHLQAQIKGLDFNNLESHDYDCLEKEMLNDFSAFTKKHPTHKWIHWNMRNSNYGFEAINNRIKILKGKPFDIHDDLKYDFPRILGQLYTYKYENDKPKGRLLNLAERNKIGIDSALTGLEEANAFDNKQYLKLHISTLRKVDIIESIIHKLEIKQLKVNASKKDIYGLSFSGILAIIRETPLLLVFSSILTFITGTITQPWVLKYFNAFFE